MNEIIETQSAEDTKILIIKGKYKSIQQNTYGLFLINFKHNEKVFESVELIASAYSHTYDIPISTSWTKIEEKIFDTKWGGNYINQTTANLTWAIETMLKSSIEVAEEMVMLAKKKDIAAVEQKLLEIFRKGLNDTQIEYSIDFDETDVDTIQKQKQSREQKQKPDKGHFYNVVPINVPEYVTVLDCLFVISPLLGIPIQELKVGSWIMVKIDDTKPKGKNYLFQLNAYHEGNPIPLPALVHQVIHHPDDTWTIVVKLQDNVYGRINEIERVKIRKFEGEGFFFEGSVQVSTPLPVQDEITGLKQDKLLIALLIGVILLIAALFIYLMYN